MYFAKTYFVSVGLDEQPMCPLLSLTRPLLTSPGHVIQIAYTSILATSYLERMKRALSTEADEKLVNQSIVSE